MLPTESPSFAAPGTQLSPWPPLIFGALAGGLAWGIRGQYGHEAGAMIAGLLVSLVLVGLLAPHAALLPAARAVALATLAMGFGGSMTYGQTIGLTQDAPLVGNWAALRWGMLGLALKGGVWIGFAGLFLGMGLGGVRYRWREMSALMGGLLVLYAAGVWVLNRPFDPTNRILPALYFSDDWRWEPDALLKPRRECWGGLLFALIGAWAWAGWFRRDALARRLVLWGLLGGALGFPLGQCLQAFHAWNPEMFQDGFWGRLDPLMNWWNWMETTFGAVMGAALGFGLWWNRRFIGALQDDGPVEFSPPVEVLLLGLHVTLLLLVEFASVSAVDALYDLGLSLALVPLVTVAGGRWAPFLVALPVTLLPIAGKTIRHLGPFALTPGTAPAWLLCGVLPLVLTTAAAVWFIKQRDQHLTASGFARGGLLLTTWLYFGLNFAFFDFPWPWQPWTARTPNALAYTLCALGLTWTCVRYLKPPAANEGNATSFVAG